MKLPLLSVVVPVFNGRRWLAEALASVRRQEVSELELLVVDDGSTDGSAELVCELAPEAQCWRQENRGAAAARNAGLGRARGEFVAFLDHDDVWPDGSLRARREALTAHPPAWFVLGRTRFLAPRAPAPWVSPNLGAALFRRGVFERLGGFDERRRMIEDVDWFLRARDAGLDYLTLPLETLHYRRGTGGVTHGRSWGEPEVLATLRDSIARRRSGKPTETRPLLSGSVTDPRAAGPVNHVHADDPTH